MADRCDIREESILRIICSFFEKQSMRNNPQSGNSEIGKYRFLYFCIQHTNWEYIHTGKQDGKYHTLNTTSCISFSDVWVPERERGWERKTVAGKGGERKHICIRTGLLTLLTQQLCTDVRRGVHIGRFFFACPSAFCQWGCRDLEHGYSHWSDTGGCLVSLGSRCLGLVLTASMSSYWGRWWAAKYFWTFGSIPPWSPTRGRAEIGK